MDAKPQQPQRPLRSLRTFNDENIHPDGPLPKTIHQRNKSSPALSGNTNVIGLKATAKRTAFGDVSNITSTARTTKEDSVHYTKPTQTVTKIPQTLQERKSAAFLRPAQRPLSVANLRNLFTSSNSSSNAHNLPSESQHRSGSVEVLPVQPTANGRKVLTKRNTAVFKDTPLETVQEIDHSDPQKHVSSKIAESQEGKRLPDITEVHQDPQLRLLPPPSATTAELTKVAQEDLSHRALQQEDLSQDIHAAPNQALTKDISESTEIHPPIRTEAEVSTAASTTPSLPCEDYVSAEGMASCTGVLIATAIKKPESQISLPSLQQAVGAQAFLPQQQHTRILPPAEPQEYWEEEEDAYDEEGYVTARSFHSKSENTTGGATTVLVPRMNQRARREIEAATKLVEATRTIEEIEDESFDTSMVAEYGDEIFEYMRQMEIKMSPNPHYMDNQHEIQWSMRSVLMDWLVQVHHRFSLLPETLFLCVNYIDRFLSCKVVSLGKLQLVGATAIFIAAKYEEINCPSVQEIVYMVDGGYSIDEVLKAERFMLTMLQFELGWPGPMSFLRRISKADDYDLETRTLAKYFLEVTLMDERFIGSPPSFTAAASHCLARLMLRKGPWSPHHVHYSGYTYLQLKPLVQLLLECCEDPAKHHRAVYDKYCDKRYKRASVFVQTEVQRGFYLQDLAPIKVFSHSPTYAYYNNVPFLGL